MTGTSAAPAQPAEVAHDVAVVGLGPAGRALTHRLLASGRSVLAIDPHPDRIWPQTLAGWARQLPTWLPRDARAVQVRAPVIRTHRTSAINDDYVVLDNAACQRVLDIGGATIERRIVSDQEFAAVTRRAAVVIDARGSRPAGTAPGRIPAQTAHGVEITSEQAAGLLRDEPAVLMDWTPFDGASNWHETPSFLYLIPTADGGYLAEETCLAAAPPMAPRQLAERLTRRLARHGITADSEAPTERVVIPLRRSGGRPAPGVLRFGAAGAELNPFTGYSVFASLAAVDPLVSRIAAGQSERHVDHPDPVRRAALRGLLGLQPSEVFALFDAFCRLPDRHRQAIFTASGTDLIVALTRQWARLPARAKLGLTAATVRGH